MRHSVTVKERNSDKCFLMCSTMFRTVHFPYMELKVELLSEINISASSRRKRRVPVKRTLAVKERTITKERPPPKERQSLKERQPSKERPALKERPPAQERPPPKERVQVKDTTQRKERVLKVKSEKKEKQKEREKEKEEEKEKVKEIDEKVEVKTEEEREKPVEIMVKSERKRPGRKKKEREPKPMIIKPPRPKAVLEGYPWQCTDCTLVLSTLQELRTHHQMEHNQLPNFKCIQCAKVYTRYRSFARHVKLHRNPKKFR